MTLKSSIVIGQALETTGASLTSAASATSLASLASTALFSQKTSWSLCFDHQWHQNDQYWFSIHWRICYNIFFVARKADEQRILLEFWPEKLAIENLWPCHHKISIEELVAIFCSHMSHHQLEDGRAEMNNHAFPHIILGSTHCTLSVLLRNFVSGTKS